MATTATISISSPDLMPGSSLSVAANTTLTKAGVTADLTQMETGSTMNTFVLLIQEMIGWKILG